MRWLVLLLIAFGASCSSYQPSSPPAPRTWRDKYQARCIAYLSLADGNAETYYDTFAVPTTSNWATAAAGSAAVARLGTDGLTGAVLSLSTGATGSSSAQIHRYTVAEMGRPHSTKWCYAARFRLTTTPDAQTQATIGWLDVSSNTKEFGVGAWGGTSTTKFALKKTSVTGVLSSVSLDTNWHDVEVYGTGTTTYSFRIDGETAVTMVDTSTTASSFGPYTIVANQATAADQTMHLAQFLYVVPGL